MCAAPDQGQSGLFYDSRNRDGVCVLVCVCVSQLRDVNMPRQAEKVTEQGRYSEREMEGDRESYRDSEGNGHKQSHKNPSINHNLVLLWLQKPFPMQHVN